VGTPVVLELDELDVARFELTRQVRILEQDSILQRAVITLNVALSHRMMRLPAQEAVNGRDDSR
jgi:hypothetical protein